MSASGKLLVHGTCLDISGAGVLIRGVSGSGKSDLALRLLHLGPTPLMKDQPVVSLVGDDSVEISRSAGALMASGPAAISGMMEVRGLGPITVPVIPRTPLVLVVDLVAFEEIERLPEPATTGLAGIEVPRVALCALEPSAPYKVAAALARVVAAGDGETRAAAG